MDSTQNRDLRRPRDVIKMCLEAVQIEFVVLGLNSLHKSCGVKKRSYSIR